MADSAHLEKMGRELKCPICLGLLNTAVSLTCNHVFCNLCILKSMKSASNCPVCKVPYHRREVRAVPHMDNLVSIYKSMEVASGINIFVSQTGDSAIKSGEGGSCSGRAVTEEPCQHKSKRRKVLKESDKTNVKTLDSVPSVKPSFPAKKRVQVPLYPLSETPMQPGKVSKLGDQSSNHDVERECSKVEGNECKKDTSVVLKEKPAFDEKGEPVFKPFFWLRDTDEDEDAQNLSSQQTDCDHLMYTPPHNAPNFSDIMDSDDESPIKLTPAGEACGKSKAAHHFDSEMFEWTQRACSPELCVTPMKKETVDRHILGGLQEKDHEAGSKEETAVTKEEIPASGVAENQNAEQENMNMEFPAISSGQNKIRNARSARKKTVKKGKRSSQKAKRKNLERSTDRPDTVSDQIDGVLTNLGKAAGNPDCINEDKYSEKSKMKKGARRIGEKSSSHSKGKHLKALMAQVSDIGATGGLEEAPIKLSEGNAEKVKVGIEFPVLTYSQTENDKALGGNKPDKHNEKIVTNSKRKQVRRSKNQIVNVIGAKVLEEIPVNHFEGTENEKHDNMVVGSPILSHQGTVNDENLDSGKKSSKRVKKIATNVESNSVRKCKELKTLKNCTDKVAKGVLPNSSRNDVKENHVVAKQKEADSGGKNSTTAKVLPIPEVHLLQKCKNICGQIQCAFCQSSDDSEASGEMLHYFNGKLVAKDHNGGFNVIHSHKNCAEWAPNVYFEDDIAINLEAELARSRRIKCCCCGIKGASLGCYEKSCRKSFHVPCAKLIPQCRWDTENFVMLCPLHSSLKLPNEISRPEKKKRKSTLEVEPQEKKRVHSGLENNRMWKWTSGSPSKWVICCSALTAAEKEIVSKFTRLAGVSMSETWSSTVTHVIASTDENGVCKRTLKFLMGILEGKWILKMDWIKACMMNMEPVGEEQYEVNIDIHEIKGGPQRGRLRVMNKGPNVFNAFKFYFSGEFVPSYKGYLQDLVVAAGGTVLQRKPISRDNERLLNESPASMTFIIYCLELPEKCESIRNALVSSRRTEAQTLANAIGAKVAGHSWILDSIAACELQNLD